MKLSLLRSISVIAILVLATPALGDAGHKHGPKAKNKVETPSIGGGLKALEMDSTRGKKLFVDKGCVACHSVNDVGGEDAAELSAHPEHAFVHPFALAARMWNHSQGMTAAQMAAFDEQVVLTGQELADITAFLHDDALQHGFSDADLTPAARKMMDHSHDGGDGHGHSETGNGH